MRLLYFGLPLGALLLLRDGHEIAQAIMGRPEGTGLRRLQRLLGDRVAFWPAPIRVQDADVLVSWFFPKKLPPAVLGLGRLGSVGVHPSLLPRHRGPDPYFAAIDQGDAVTGVTAHRLLAEYDTGAMLDSETLPIDPAWDAWTLARKLDRPSLRVLRRVVGAIGAGTVTETTQDEALATDAPAPSEDDLELDVHALDPEAAVRRIRAAAPWPGAYFFAGDDCVVVERARVAMGAPALEPGELAEAWLGVRRGAIAIERVRLEDDTVLTGEAFRAWVRERS